MSFSRKHFQAIAEIVYDANQAAYVAQSPEAQDIVADLAKELASFLRSTNPQFDRARFLDAAGYHA